MSFMSLSTTWVKESSSEEEFTKFKQVAPINKIVKEKLQKPISERKKLVKLKQLPNLVMTIGTFQIFSAGHRY